MLFERGHAVANLGSGAVYGHGQIVGGRLVVFGVVDITYLVGVREQEALTDFDIEHHEQVVLFEGFFEFFDFLVYFTRRFGRDYDWFGHRFTF